MAKRDWCAVANDLSQGLNIPIDLIPNKRPRRTAVSKYNIGTDDASFKLSAKFLEKRAVHRKHEKAYTLRNNVNDRKVKVSTSNNGLTFGNLKAEFEKIGHCIAYCIYDSYTTKLMFDFDCKKCKDGICNNPIEVDLIENTIISELCAFIDSILGINNSEDVCVVFKKEQLCNLHIYFNITVSIVFYEIIRKRLIQSLDTIILDKYEIDDIITLDLPYSTKDGFSIYKPVIGSNFDHFTCLPDIEFYDLKQNLSVNEMYATDIVLGSFVISNINWFESVDEVKYVSTPIELEVFKTKAENYILKNLKLSNRKFKTDYTLLGEYVSLDQQAPTEEEDVQDFTITLNNAAKKKIYNTILTLSRLISKNVFNKQNQITDKEAISMLFKFMMVDNCNYCFYVLCATIFYCYNSNDAEYTLSMCRKHVIEIITEAAKSFVPNNKILTINLEFLLKFECMSNLSSTFSKCNVWFLYISQIIRLKECVDNSNFFEKCITYILSQMRVYGTVEAILDDLVEFCKMVIPIIKISSGSGRIYYYKDGMYHNITSEKFMSNGELYIQLVEMAMKRMLKFMVESNQTQEEVVKKFNFKNVWIVYLTTIESVNIQFNFYDYFINTELGVFNTITGLYMKSVPLLIMNTQKAYCRIPTLTKNDIKSMTISEINNHIIHEQKNHVSLSHILLNEQDKLFYCAVMLPGLLKLDETLCTEAQERTALEYIGNKIYADENLENEHLMYFIEPVLEKYKLNIDKIVSFTKLFKKNINEYGEFSRPSLSTYCNGNDIRSLTPQENKFVYEENITLYDNLVSTYGESFNSKIFTLVTCLVVFDITQEPLFEHFKFSDDECILEKLSPNHIFYDWRNQNFSIGVSDNYKRAIEYLIPDDRQLNISHVNIIQTISTTFGFNSAVIRDFMSSMSMIYHHSSSRKKLVLLVGSMSSGKSTFQHMLNDIHGLSVYSVDGMVQSSGMSGPSPETFHTHSNYLFNIIEVKSINANTVKSLIGSDVVHKRMCHQNEMFALKPLSFVIAAANKMPNILHADEAVRDRLAPFLFSRVYIDEADIGVRIDDNQLLAYVCNYMITSTRFKIESIAKEFSNLLYEHFTSIRNTNGLIRVTLSEDNISSEKLIRSCLIRNNIIYSLLYDCNISFNQKLSITYDDLKELIEPKLKDLNDGNNRFKYTWDYVKSEISMLFKNKETFDRNAIIGLGVKSSESDKCNSMRLLEYDDSSEVRLNEIKVHLFRVEKIPFNEIHAIYEKLKRKYSAYYNSETQTFRCHKIRK
ncbi:helicase [Penaeus vannamei nudivirus]|nr:helicase [Penaeus vannamei nucleopolyhedrovirus]